MLEFKNDSDIRRQRILSPFITDLTRREKQLHTYLSSSGETFFGLFTSGQTFHLNINKGGAFH